MHFPIRLSSVEKEGMFRASKWLKHGVLLDPEEIKSLFSSVKPCYLIPASGFVTEDSWSVSLEEFLEQYRLYLEWMSSEEALPPPSMRRFFSLMITSSLDALYAVRVSSDKIAIKAKVPVIQMQMFHCFYSRFDHQIRSMVISPDSFSWGIQISYPQIYEDPKTHEHSKVLLNKTFPNTEPFKEMVSWLRKNTQPVPLSEGEKKTYAPFRIGKSSFDQRKTHLGFQKMLLAKQGD